MTSSSSSLSDSGGLTLLTMDADRRLALELPAEGPLPPCGCCCCCGPPADVELLTLDTVESVLTGDMVLVLPPPMPQPWLSELSPLSL